MRSEPVQTERSRMPKLLSDAHKELRVVCPTVCVMTNSLEVENDGRLRVLRLNRPERKNALNGELLGTIVGAVRDAAHDHDVWALALTGNGDAFCSGLDLAANDSDQDDEAERTSAPDNAADNFATVMRVECEKPILAGVNGVAVGIGVSLAMAADIRIAAPSARFHPGYARVATSPDGGATVTISQALGYEGAMRFFLEQRMISATEARDIGLVGEVTESDAEFEERFLAYGRMLAGIAPIAAQQTKRLVSRVTTPAEFRAHLDEEIRLALHGLSSEDSREAIRAMTTKESPHFKGR
jgi:2-(1,2-epoxy-1,2-dihydrophenyl)acetyl-CoA isomerase